MEKKGKRKATSHPAFVGALLPKLTDYVKERWGRIKKHLRQWLVRAIQAFFKSNPAVEYDAFAAATEANVSTVVPGFWKFITDRFTDEIRSATRGPFHTYHRLWAQESIPMTNQGSFVKKKYHQGKKRIRISETYTY